MSADETFHPDSEPIRLNGSFNSKQSIESLLQSIAGQPVLEQQLRYLAKQLGYDANSNFPDRQTIEALRSFVGTKLMNSVNSSPLPTSVASINFHKKNPFINNINVGEEDNKLPKQLSIPTNFKPIFPVNNQQVIFLGFTGLDLYFLVFIIIENIIYTSGVRRTEFGIRKFKKKIFTIYSQLSISK